MNVTIIEDESLSVEHLHRMLQKVDPKIMVTAAYDSVKESIDVFTKGISSDLLFVDIHLADGLSFDLFSKVTIDIPVIFTTAYSEYAIKAFEVNSIDYLLKPIGFEELKRAIDKFKKLNNGDHKIMLENISKAYHQLARPYKSRFMVKVGTTIDSIKADDIFHFTTLDGITFLVIENGKRYAIDYTLDQLESLMSPEQFFRINRKTILSIQSIHKVSSYFNSRLVISSPHLEGEACIVSRERVNDFKLWLDI